MTIPIKEKLLLELKPFCKAKGFELLDLKYSSDSQRSGSTKLTLVVSKNGASPGVEDCAELSREVSILLDVLDLINEAYVLEVSSTGCDNLLFFTADYKKHVGRLVKLELNRVKNQIIQAYILGVQGGKIKFKNLDGSKTELSFSNIKTATLVDEENMESIVNED